LVGHIHHRHPPVVASSLLDHVVPILEKRNYAVAMSHLHDIDLYVV
jgi:hypothetical protein